VSPNSRLRLKYTYDRFVRARGLLSFLSGLPTAARLLDIGCGNDSSYRIKSLFPAIHYTGVDVGDYNNSKPNLADRYVVTSADDFAAGIAELGCQFDAVVSSHNLEHCNDRVATLNAMIGAVVPQGRMYLSFPSEASVRLPSRRRTLNYFDDPTHKGEPPSFDWVIRTLGDAGFRVDFDAREYRPSLLRCLGWAQEPWARWRNDILQGSWAYHGFESIIWATRSRADQQT
jgi:SAM-dependent methyltransferase